MKPPRLPAIAALLCTAALLGACAGTQSALRFPQLPAEARSAPGEFLLVTVANSVAGAPGGAGSTVRGYADDSGYTVSATAQRSVRELARDHHLAAVSAWPIDALGVHCVVFRKPASLPLEAVLAELRADSRVAVAQPLQTFSTRSGFNDPFATLQASLVELGIPAASQLSRGRGVKVALIDTGVDTAHPDLAGRVSYTQNFVDGDGRAFRADLHGTAVAGVIAAQANNRLGIAGVAPEADLLALKACWQSADSAHALCNSFTLAQALAVAMSQGARIVNMSLAGPSDPLLGQMVHWGAARGVIFVGATADSGRAEGFPSELPDVLAVASAKGDRSSPAAGVLHAPGEQVLTLTPGGHYDFASGSSIAAANLSGVAALLLSVRELRTEPLRALLLQSRSTPGGSINACNALNGLGPDSHCSATAAAAR